MLTLIAAAAENDALGKDNAMLWHLPDDFKHFKDLTSHHFIIMGRKTFETFPKPLPNRTHIIITRQEDYDVPASCIVVNSLEKALDLVTEQDESFIIGGGEIYDLAMPFADKIELTRVHTELEADTFFPIIDENQWKVVREEFHDKDVKHQYSFTFLTYIKS